MSNIKKIIYPNNESKQFLHCPIHGDYEIIKFPFGVMFSTCPDCADANAKKFEQERSFREAKEKLEDMNKRKNSVEIMRSMGIRKKYYNADFDTFIPENNEFGEKQLFAKRVIETMVQKKKGTVFLFGGNGTRKTTLAIAGLRNYGDGYYSTLYELSFLLRSEKTDDYKTGVKLLMFLKNTPMLIIDEVGKSNCSEFEKNWLFDVLNSRDSDELPSVLIYNSDTNIDDIFEPSMKSRFSTAIFCEMNGTDFRVNSL